ncbi:hypothetical protein C7S18_04430 [Ahniella affigens]|uniref:Nudix hydrolase domain-containing protein n=1 Tax=Ahniella affigens TaxID=2021234 RepID=A0A2P1PNS1_9GAMM|nr:NUDIX hydrolase [Ahniella affigens]AVP96488.1 hypothetical protein C7S18_04430 [Ahniella affigens]
MQYSRPVSRQPIPSNAQKVHSGKLFDVFVWEQQLFDGSVTSFEKIQRPDTSYIIPITNTGNLILAKQVQPSSAPSVGLIGGRVEPGEDPEVAARRELSEEAGLVAEGVVLWQSFQFLPKIDWAIYIFLTRGFRTLPSAKPDPGECISLLEVSFEEFIELVSKEEFGDLEVALKVLRLAHDPKSLAQMKFDFLGSTAGE